MPSALAQKKPVHAGQQPRNNWGTVMVTLLCAVDGSPGDLSTPAAYNVLPARASSAALVAKASKPQWRRKAGQNQQAAMPDVGSGRAGAVHWWPPAPLLLAQGLFTPRNRLEAPDHRCAGWKCRRS